MLKKNQILVFEISKVLPNGQNRICLTNYLWTKMRKSTKNLTTQEYRFWLNIPLFRFQSYLSFVLDVLNYWASSGHSLHRAIFSYHALLLVWTRRSGAFNCTFQDFQPILFSSTFHKPALSYISFLNVHGIFNPKSFFLLASWYAT